MAIKWYKSTCPYCGFGCGLLVGEEKGRVVKIRGMEEHPANHGDVCSIRQNLIYIINWNIVLRGDENSI